MAYIYGERDQKKLFPASIDEYVQSDDPVRVYDAFINELDLKELGIHIDYNKGGQDEYDPRTMLKLIVYGYANNVRTSRKLEVSCRRDLAFIWLTGNLAPDYRTISRFRRKHQEGIQKVLRAVVRLCIRWDMVEGNALFIDSTVMQANASVKKTFTHKNITERLARVDAHIEQLLKETRQIDEEQEMRGSLVKIREGLLSQEAIRKNIREIEEELKGTERRELNTTDKDSVLVKTGKQCRAGYRAQTVVDDKNGLIVSTDVVASSSDRNQLSVQINNAQEIIGKSPEVVVSDCGYACINDAAKIDEEITVVTPSQQLVAGERQKNSEGTAKDFIKDKFTYDALTDSYQCPEGQQLPFRFFSATSHGQRIKNYRPEAQVCKSCRHFGKCTNNSQGRKITRHENEYIKERMDAVYQSAIGQEFYARRKIRCELPFAQIKHNDGFRRFLLRGLKGVNLEFALLAVAHNLTRMISLLSVQGFLSKLEME